MASIHIDRESEISIAEQVAAQLVYLIGAGRIRAGEPLPSARELALRLKVHRNTVSEAFKDATLASLVEKGHGKRLRVRRDTATMRGSHLDLLIDETVAAARKAGYTPRQLYERMRHRLGASPPARLLVVSEDPGMRVLIAIELRRRFACRVEECAPEVVSVEGSRGVGALVVTTPASLSQVERLLPAGQPVVSLRYAPVDEHVALVRGLPRPSVIGVASISSYFLALARGLLAPAIGRRHSLQEHLLNGRRSASIGAVDVLFCDAVTYGVVRVRCPDATIVRHDMIAEASFVQIEAALTGA